MSKLVNILIIVIVILCLGLWVENEAKGKVDIKIDEVMAKLVTVEGQIATLTRERDALRMVLAQRSKEVIALRDKALRDVSRLEAVIKGLRLPVAVAKTAPTRILTEKELTDREKLNKLQKASLAEHKGEVKERFDRHRSDVIDVREHRQQIEVNQSRRYQVRRPARRGGGTVQQQQYRSGGGGR